MKDTEDLHLRRVDIDSWQSPVARQHRIARLPYLQLYENGRMIADGTDAVLGRARQRPQAPKR